jgi:hypothetical protein
MTASYVEHYQVSAAIRYVAAFTEAAAVCANEQLAPVAGLVKDRAHFITMITIAVEPTMLEFHARPGG